MTTKVTIHNEQGTHTVGVAFTQGDYEAPWLPVKPGEKQTFVLYGDAKLEVKEMPPQGQ